MNWLGFCGDPVVLPKGNSVMAKVLLSRRGEVGVELEGFVVEVGDGGLTQLIEVVGQDLRREAHGNALGALCEQERELHGQHDGLLVAAVVGELPLGGLGVEDHVEGELRQARLDVATGGGIVAREDVAPVTLAVDEQLLLAQLHQGILDAGVAVGVELHRVTHDVRDLVEAPVVHALHGVQDAALHRLKAVADVWHGTLQDNV